MSNITLCEVIVLPIELSKVDVIISHQQINIKDEGVGGGGEGGEKFFSTFRVPQ